MNNIEILEYMIKDYENKIEHEYVFSDYYIQKIKKEKQAIENLLENSKKIIELNYIPKSKIINLLENEVIDISGFECISARDLQELLVEGEYYERRRNN